MEAAHRMHFHLLPLLSHQMLFLCMQNQNPLVLGLLCISGCSCAIFYEYQWCPASLFFLLFLPASISGARPSFISDRATANKVPHRLISTIDHCLLPSPFPSPATRYCQAPSPTTHTQPPTGSLPVQAPLPSPVVF
jgi:hypothetical protein